MSLCPHAVLRTVLPLLAGLALALPVRAQSAGKGFLFAEPSVNLTVRGGFAHASAGSDIFAFTTEQLTLGRDDFSSFLAGADLGVRLLPRVDLMLGAAYAGATSPSEMREYVEEVERDGEIVDVPIRQTTRFQRVPLTVGARAYLLPRGRSVGRFAWIPSRFAPFVGAGGGAMWYRFDQRGDFVDVESPDLEIFYAELRSTGWAPTAHALAGVDVSLSPRFALTGEARYAWAEAELSQDFQDFAPIDLSGLMLSLGLHVRF